MKYPDHINEKGQQSIAKQIAEMGCDYDLAGTISEIEQTNTFMDAQEGRDLSVESGLRYPTGYTHFWVIAADEITFSEMTE